MNAPANRLALEYVKRHPVNVARLLERGPAEKAAALLADSPPERAAALLGHTAPNFASACLSKLSLERRAAVVSALPVAGAAALLRCMSPEPRNELLSSLSQEVKGPLEQTLAYPENTAGALMDPTVLVLHSDLDVEEALERIRAFPGAADSRNYVVDRAQKLIGWVTAARLLQADHRALVGSLATEAAYQPRPTVGAHFLIRHASWPKEEEFPVVDEQGLFLGVVRRNVIERIAQGLGTHSTAGHPAHPLLAVGELYWVGLCEFLGGLSSGPRSVLEGAAKSGGTGGTNG